MQNSSRRSRGGGLTNKEVLDLVRPVGSYFETDSATPPSTLWPWTTWEQVKDRFLVGAGNLYAVGTTGGEATHKHTYDLKFSDSCADGYGTKYTEGDTVPSSVHYTGNASSLPPYYAVYFWHRTA
jgi:hypothetical protein